ncbi:hypothetical protein Tco_0875129 [Tanacetum coccineum]|uniref:Uncharacterized protein n=1 Tax=Tanacetum coccineum TaxID=301880 RepID=A0ABQ5BRM1_9ASTR
MYFLSIMPWGLDKLDQIFRACSDLCLKSKLQFIYLLSVSGQGPQTVGFSTSSFSEENQEDVTPPPNLVEHPPLAVFVNVEDKLTYFEHPIPVFPILAPGQVVPPDVLIAHTTWVKASKEIAGLMLITMDLKI